MENLNSLVSILAVFSQIAVSLVSIIALLSAIFKPVRNFVTWLYKKVFGNKSKNDEILKQINELKKTFMDTLSTLENTLSSKIQEVSDRNDENEKDRIRWEVLDFANSCRNGRKHSKEEFAHIIELKDKYEKLLAKTGESNGVFEEDYGYIKSLYADCLEKNNFLA